MKVHIKDIKKQYNGRVVLNIDNLEFEQGKIYAIIGANGSGKTTLLRIIGRLDRQDEGIIYYGNNTTVRRGDIAYLPQKVYMFDTTVLNNVLIGIRGQNNSHSLSGEVLKVLKMQSFSNARANSLSGGDAQKIALARTLVTDTKLILLDEPASEVDVASMKQVEDYIMEVNKRKNATVIFTTHNPSQSMRMADYVIFLHNGKILEKGNPRNIISSPSIEETQKFLEFWSCL